MGRHPARRRLWSCLLIAILLGAGCATPRTSVREEASLLPRPGARVAMGGVGNASGETFEVDAVGMLREALQTALREQGLAAAPDGSGASFDLELEITEYRPGNAFQRWLLPGWGSTVLAVQGTLRDAQRGSLVATITYQRSVHFGGLYTVGAWQTIFSSVAEDIAKDLKVKIEQGGAFVVALRPRAEQGVAPQPVGTAPKIKVDPLTDARPVQGRIGERTAAFGVSMGEIHLNRPVAVALREALTDDLLVGGYRVVESDQDLTARGEVLKFWVHTDTTALFWDIVGEVEIALTLESAAPGVAAVRRSYDCRAVERTYVWPSEALVGKALDRCLEDMMQRVRADPVWPAGKR